MSFVHSHPWPSTTFSLPFRWGAPPSPSEAFNVSVTLKTSAADLRNVIFGFQLAESGRIASASSGQAFLELLSGPVVLARIQHRFGPTFEPATPLGGPIFHRAEPGESITARCALTGGVVPPVAGDTFEARILVWGFQEFTGV